VVGANLAFEAQHLQDELANPTRLLAPLSLQGFTFVALRHMDGEVGDVVVVGVVVALGVFGHRCSQ